MAGPDILKLDESSDENINYPSERKSFGDFIRELLKTKVPDLRDDLELKNSLFNKYEFKNEKQESRIKYLRKDAAVNLTHVFVGQIKEFLLKKKYVKKTTTINFDRSSVLKWFFDNKVKNLSEDDLKLNYSFTLIDTEKQELLNLFFDSNANK